MITYHPSGDSFHTALRLLCLLKLINNPVSVEKLYILDFYYVFPSYLNSFKATLESKKDIKNIIENESTYSGLPNARSVFQSVNEIQKYSLDSLVRSSLVTLTANEEVLFNRKTISDDLLKLIDEKVMTSDSLLDLLTKKLATIEISGENGLKKRSGLMEYHYDP